ncbi:hypothetical protein FM103_14105 [Corynebacterium xerosis]|nr:hypothetical protein FM103_14105 [Corynebacterium xerosis]
MECARVEERPGTPASGRPASRTTRERHRPGRVRPRPGARRPG